MNPKGCAEDGSGAWGLQAGAEGRENRLGHHCTPFHGEGQRKGDGGRHHAAREPCHRQFHGEGQKKGDGACPSPRVPSCGGGEGGMRPCLALSETFHCRRPRWLRAKARGPCGQGILMSMPGKRSAPGQGPLPDGWQGRRSAALHGASRQGGPRRWISAVTLSIQRFPWPSFPCFCGGFSPSLPSW